MKTGCKMQMCNMKKKYITNLVITSPKKQATTQVKSPTLSTCINAYNKQSSPKASSVGKKIHNIVLQGESKPGQRETTRFSKNETPDQNFLK